jgi:anti-sigma regulatory factor (Ser/Thr protein kinase)
MNATADRSDFDRDYDGIESVRVARSDVLEWMGHRGADVEASRRAVLIVSELASNAVQESPRTAYHVHLSTIDTSTLDIAVRNRRTVGSSPPESNSFVGPLAPRGRGLAIVESLSHGISVQVTDNEIRVSTTCAAQTNN